MIQKQKRFEGTSADYSADLVVAGAGVSGVFAALSAAMNGLDVILVERFGQIGGNMGGSGLLIAGDARVRPFTEAFWDKRFYGKVAVIDDFLSEVKDRLDGVPNSYPELSQAFSRTASSQVTKYGIRLILSSYAADPIIEEKQTKGIYVETAGGRIAIRSKYVIDACGDAGIAARAGAPCKSRQNADEVESPNMYHIYMDRSYRYWNDGGIYYILKGVDYNGFLQWYNDENVCLTEEEAEWKKENLNIWLARSWKPPIVPLLKEAWEGGEFKVLHTPRERMHVHFDNWFEELGPGLLGGRAQIFGEYEPHRWEDISCAEKELRDLIYDGISFFRKKVPGFQKASLVCQAAFLGSRGGRHIIGRHLLSPADMFNGSRHPHVLFSCGTEIHRGAALLGFDVPYGILLPQGIENLLVCGRGASYLRRGHDPSIRARPNLMLMGAAGGLAIAEAERQGRLLSEIDITALQKVLYETGFYLGEGTRLKELGL